MSFTHLHVHSEYSLLDGLAGVKQLVRAAQDFGMKSLALTDHGDMSAVVDFYNQFRFLQATPDEAVSCPNRLVCQILFVRRHRLHIQ